jgi:hypothetical protein
MENNQILSRNPMNSMTGICLRCLLPDFSERLSPAYVKEMDGHTDGWNVDDLCATQRENAVVEATEYGILYDLRKTMQSACRSSRKPGR